MGWERPVRVWRGGSGEWVGAWRNFRPNRLRVAVFRFLGGGGGANRRGSKPPPRRIKLLLQLLDLLAEALDLLAERRLGRCVSRRLLQDLSRADEPDLERGLRPLRVRLPRRRHRSENAEPRPHRHCKPHNTSP